MSKLKKIIAITLSLSTIAGIGVNGITSVNASGTGAGLAEYALNAYYEGWSYVWGGTEPGAVDCSGLIWSYCGGDRMEMLYDAQSNGRDWGYVSDGIPRVHGLGLSRPNHVGVYIEDGMEVDARGSDYGVCYQQIGENGWNNWDCWFKLTAVTYPEYGWESFNGNYYYYEDGEYIVNTSRTIDGTTYYFDSKGHSSETPSDMSSVAEDNDDFSKSSRSSEQTTPSFWSKGSTGSEVEKIQQRLAELGYYSASIDGIFGPITDAAFRAFQQNAGLFVDGIAGSDREVLYADSAPAAKIESVQDIDSEDKSDTSKEDVNEDNDEPDTDNDETMDANNESEASEEPEEPTQETTKAKEEPAVLAENYSYSDYQNIGVFAVYGDANDEVIEAQHKLTDLGYYAGDITGFLGDYTQQAIINFQLANGLIGTGELDSETYALMFSDNAVASQINPVGSDESVQEADIQQEVSNNNKNDKTELKQEKKTTQPENKETSNTNNTKKQEKATSQEQATVSNSKEEIANKEQSAKTGSNKSTSPSSNINASNAKTLSNATKMNANANKAANMSIENAATKLSADSKDPLSFVKGIDFYLWIILAVATLGCASFIFVMYRKRPVKKHMQQKKTSKQSLKERW